jgi:Flp pilus assembly pilin Flp
MIREVEKFFRRFAVRLPGMAGSELAQTLAEYGLITTLVAVGVTILAMVSFRTALVGGFNAMSGYLTGGG